MPFSPFSPPPTPPQEAAAWEAEEAPMVRGDQYLGEMIPVNFGETTAGRKDLDGDLTCEMILNMLNEWGDRAILTARHPHAGWERLASSVKFVTLGSHSFFQSWRQCLELFACFSLNIYKIKTNNMAGIL